MSKICELDSKAFVDHSVESLRSAGIRITSARLAILQELSELQQPKTARELFELMARRKRSEKVNQVTVYRIIEKFEEFGLVHRVLPSGGYLPCFHRDCGNSPHILIRCSACEDISELGLPQETLAPVLWYLKGKYQFFADSSPLQISGICSTCNENVE